MGLATLGFGFVAGLLSVLSPCVLPVLPLIFAPAVSAHRHGAIALAGGLVISFVAIGLFIATIGFSLGLEGDWVRSAAAVLLGLVGVVLLSGALQQRFALATGGLGNGANALLQRLAPSGLGGQFAVGLLLGAVWSPCVGPTLGAASVLAAQGRDLGGVAGVMVAFGLGAALPLVLVGGLSREVLARWRGRMMDIGKGGKMLLGSASLAVAALILTGLDRQLETVLVNASPAWLTALTTHF
ncbi:MAG: cytochrome c biogenesis protein CcdA [Rhodospirillales bacterium]|nr:cytochrome c biogenesis protein CcdA [Rhodospirillales bacterium]MDE2576742.1 cytochrome c biogenesis protein CcdA [Rhodospirillales bacterium]